MEAAKGKADKGAGAEGTPEDDRQPPRGAFDGGFLDNVWVGSLQHRPSTGRDTGNPAGAEPNGTRKAVDLDL
ncbi:hypothetical protein [Martelella sp. HB161492]|uniref:hypothetical protein n=1 Tax=Martelella sp. HB161492 TaxID=2720726 RepID=UPI001591514E|nr:hypothetical protein [Martelella sp. HB161492]